MTSTGRQFTIRDATRADVPDIVAMYADDVFGATRERHDDPLPAEYRDAFEAIDQPASTRTASTSPWASSRPVPSRPMPG